MQTEEKNEIQIKRLAEKIRSLELNNRSIRSRLDVYESVVDSMQNVSFIGRIKQKLFGITSQKDFQMIKQHQKWLENINGRVKDLERYLNSSLHASRESNIDSIMKRLAGLEMDVAKLCKKIANQCCDDESVANK